MKRINTFFIFAIRSNIKFRTFFIMNFINQSSYVNRMPTYFSDKWHCPFNTCVSFLDSIGKVIKQITRGCKIGRMFSHWDLPPDVMPLVADSNAGAFYWLDSTKFQGRIL